MPSDEDIAKSLRDFLLSEKGKDFSIKDVADRFRSVLVKCPCCNHTIKIKVKL